MKRLLATTALLSGIAFADLAGTVTLSSGSGLSGVTVSLAKNTKYGNATTSSKGVWSLATGNATGIVPQGLRSDAASSSVLLDHGHLKLSFAGADAAGRRIITATRTEESSASGVAARTTAVTDTLLFSWNGSVRARLPIGSLDSSGITTVIDTLTVDAGTTTTSWATGCADAAVTCVSGTWTDSGPDPDHSAFKLIKESDHFVIYSDETISDSLATAALNVMENTVWKNLFESNLYMPAPYCQSSKKLKPVIHVHSDWGLTGGGWSSDRIGMWIGSGALSDHWGLTHEFTHAWQTITSAEGGMNCYDSNTCGWIHESHANYTPHQLSEYATETHCSEMLFNMPHLYLGSTRDRYCNWQFMEYLKDKYCPAATNAIWTESGSDPFTNIQSSQGWTVSQLNDFFGDWAMHNVIWDYRTSGPGFRSAYGGITDSSYSSRLRRLMPLEALDTSNWATTRRFVSPYYGAPQRFGYNVVRLFPVSGDTVVTVRFRGVSQSNADFRWGLVATNSALTSARYSKLQSGLSADLAFKVNNGEPLFLVVMATPSVFQHIIWDKGYDSISRYPYMVEFTGAWPAGFQNGSRDACPSGLERHANGGGCAPSSTPSTVYVGPYAMVMSGASVTGSARIEDEAIITSEGTVSGGTIGGLSIIGSSSGYYNTNAFTVSGTPTIRTTFYPLGYFEANQSVSGSANVFGDVEYRGSGTNRSSGYFSGYVDASSSSINAPTESTPKGPYTWRE